MYDFHKACAEALQYQKKKHDNTGVAEIAELPDRWIFRGYGGGAFGNNPVTVDKESGMIKDFPLSLVENQDLYYDTSVLVDVPPEFR